MSHTPPVSKDGFAYANDAFFAEVSNQNRHRRATLPELQSLFDPSTPTTGTATAEKEPVGHWYGAQLLHYGLPPSKSKAVAKTRLLDAVNKGTLSVPEHIRRLEVELKEWQKNERVAKMVAKDQRTTNSLEADTVNAKNSGLSRGKDATKGKRKRDEEGTVDGGAFNINVSLTFGTNEPLRSETTSSKRAKQTTRRSGSNVAEAESSRTPARPKQTARRIGSNVTETEPEKAAARPKQTARYSGPPRGAASSRGRATPTSGRSRGTAGTKHEVSTSQNSHGALSRNPQRVRQTARCSRGSNRGRGRGASTLGQVKHESDSEDKVKIEGSFKEEDSDTSDYQGHYNSYGYSVADDDGTDQSQPPHELGPLGLINGMYTVESSDLDEWSMFDAEDFSLILCLEGNSIWGAYDFGMHSGIIHLRDRPYTSSFDELSFSWRGRENSEGQMSFGPSNHGWLRFLGNGRIDGMINCYGNARFSGERISGEHETRAPRDARSMRSEWEGYNQREYDRANRARWGGSGSWW